MDSDDKAPVSPKFSMGATHFLCRTLPRVRTELSLASPLTPTRAPNA